MSTQNPQAEKSSGNGKAFLIIIILILLGVIGYLIWGNMQKGDQITQQEQAMEADSAEIARLAKELEDYVLAYERVKMENQELGLSNDTLEQQIQELNEYIKQVKAGNAKKIKEYKSMIAKLQSDLHEKDAMIVSIRKERDSLAVRVDTLSKENLAMNDSIVQMRTVRTELSEKVEIASVLKAEGIKVTVLNSKGKEYDKDEFKAKNIEKLKVVFNLANNKVARKDKKVIAMRLIEPNGSPLFDLATGGGFFKSKETGKEIPYTEKRTINFDNTGQEVSFMYLKGSPYKAGTYKLELYGDGYLIGETTIFVK